ncbi:hypothetical protein HBI25_207550 [Parastagonospora nodorum]|nr:hypothetical protein HBH53_237620 [Parastagonospora nodorum]KAH4112312.1 hypothetical protein HBH47_227980 [Parastagonospora nodorum]KAH4289620.1 hypothetical protein HBI02_205290 [Parastagonospora nodorum]KAH4289964.1 hypothetical protein HBI01_204120 [Parastagonospora nodorum]KAH4322413.1 hypothetical protein HBI00_200250 [Parastagonospora nodorum]
MHICLLFTSTTHHRHIAGQLQQHLPHQSTLHTTIPCHQAQALFSSTSSQYGYHSSRLQYDEDAVQTFSSIFFCAVWAGFLASSTPGTLLVRQNGTLGQWGILMERNIETRRCFRGLRGTRLRERFDDSAHGAQFVLYICTGKRWRSSVGNQVHLQP